ncbi:probable RNA-binding protein 19 [Cyprinus carpio]|uniref:Probable RNA-binding protein 19 n=1 Tax=Cyprinus carpio TaxID=7962 RepID=A0A9R0A1V9_CYPCA|nr:probable RNA-binding protein 19 [Cyprinus carpio]
MSNMCIHLTQAWILPRFLQKAFTALCHSTHLYGRRLVLEWADAEETVDDLRRKTAQHFHDAPKKRRKAEVLEGILEQMEVGEEDVE